MRSIGGVGSGRDLQFTTVGREDQIERGKFEHALHPGHGEAAEADLRGLETHEV